MFLLSQKIRYDIPKAALQRGSVLIISLIFLLITTLIGVTAMQTTTLEERMAGNTRDRNLAFQAAEATLRDAEVNYIEGLSLAAVNNFNGTGLYGENDAEPDIYSLNWANNAREYGDSGNDFATDVVYEDPRYIVKIMTSDAEPPLVLGGYGAGTSGGSPGRVWIFRITARGVGGSDRSQAFLRTTYAKSF